MTVPVRLIEGNDFPPRVVVGLNRWASLGTGDNDPPGMRVVLNVREIRYLEYLKALPFRAPKKQGICAECGRVIPEGYVPWVLNYETENWGPGFKHLAPVKMWCQPCGKELFRGYRREQRKTETVMGAKEIAEKLLACVSGIPRSAKQLCKAGGIEDTEKAMQVLEVLMKAAKVRKVSGRWVKRSDASD